MLMTQSVPFQGEFDAYIRVSYNSKKCGALRGLSVITKNSSTLTATIKKNKNYTKDNYMATLEMCRVGLCTMVI